MRIAFLLTQSLESPSGLGRYWPMSKELVRLGHQVTILALHHDYASLMNPRFSSDGVEVHYVAQMHVRKTGNTKTYYSPARMLLVTATATWRLARAALTTPADVYHLGKPHPMNGSAGLLARFAGHKRVYLDCDDYELASNRFGGDWQRWGVALFENRLPAIAAGITTNTRATATRLASSGYPSHRIVYVPNGVDRLRFGAARIQDVETLRRSLGLEDRKIVLYVGSMSLANHAVDLLLEAFRLVRGVEQDAYLLLVGGGEDYERLQNMAVAYGLLDCSRFVGRLAPDQVVPYYALATVSVDPVRDSPAERSRSPLKVLESLAAGTPVVTGDVGDRAILLANGGGVLVPAGSATALGEGILSLLRDQALQSRLGAETSCAVQPYYWDVLVREFVKVYEHT